MFVIPEVSCVSISRLANSSVSKKNDQLRAKAHYLETTFFIMQEE
jgi:hypothetical protein